jgi:hypothetical protein
MKMGNELMHYGVKGMRWGVINSVARESGNILNESSKLSKMRNTRKKHAEDTKATSAMTDDDLRKRVSRLNLEKQYSTLSQESISKGRARFNRIVEVAGPVLAITASMATIAELLAKKGE